MSSEATSRSMLVSKVRPNYVRRVDEDLRGYTRKESLDAAPIWRIMQHVEIDVARRVRVTPNDRARGDDPDWISLGKNERYGAAQCVGIRFAEFRPSTGAEKSVIHGQTPPSSPQKIANS